MSAMRTFDYDLAAEGTQCNLCDFVIQVDEKHQKGPINQHIKSARHQNLQSKSAANIALPPDVVVTPWGSWITCAMYYCKNFNKIWSFLKELPEDSISAAKAKALIQNEVLKDELLNITM
uniref:Uncharacterized protein n=1 Tax=Romanomermis culicivorax TaxID=13658 RepID=A0A915KCA8_ROMCU